MTRAAPHRNRPPTQRPRPTAPLILKITDHHTESRRFLTHLAKEESQGRIVPADWSWIVPPVSGGLTPVFHRYYDEADLDPSFRLDDRARSLGLGETVTHGSVKRSQQEDHDWARRASMGRVEGMVVAITGAARGQGRSHAASLAEEGAGIVAIDVCADIDVATYPMTTAADLDEHVWLVGKTGRPVVARQVEVRDHAALKSAAGEAVAELGRLDAVIPNAGMPPKGAALPVDTFTGVLDVNLVGMVSTVQAALPHQGEGGSVLAVGSITSFLPPGPEDSAAGPGMADYKLAKPGRVDCVNALADQLALAGRRANGVHPTLLSDESRFTTGMHLKVDAGALLEQGR